MSVGLVYRPTTILSSTRHDFVSRKMCSSLETSAVNFIVGRKLLALGKKSSRLSRP